MLIPLTDSFTIVIFFFYKKHSDILWNTEENGVSTYANSGIMLNNENDVEKRSKAPCYKACPL